MGLILGGGAPVVLHSAQCTLSKMVLNVVNSGPKSFFPDAKGLGHKKWEFKIGLILGGGAH